MSFSGEIKDHLCSQHIKNRCCRRAMIYGMLYSAVGDGGDIRFMTDNESASVLLHNLLKSVYSVGSEYDMYDKLTQRGSRVMVYKLLVGDDIRRALGTDIIEPEPINRDIFVCENCGSHFLRGVFVSDGTINDPTKGYHLEFSVSDDIRRERLIAFMREEGFGVKSTRRKNIGSVYIKESESIEDILTYIGASRYSIKIMDVKIEKEIRNNENRRSNCDMANIYKSTDAAALLIKAINRMIADGRIDGLGENLKTTAMLRINYPELTMSELAGIHEPPITKSGLSHRIAKIMKYYDACYRN